MPQYLIHAYDGTDPNALDRRMAVRPFHLEGAKRLKAAGQFIIGGAILSDEGTMIGSVMILEFETQEVFDEWYRTEPYITQGVWQRIEVKPFRVANV
ncbi:MAG: YciI family protein [Spirosomataceae bacterium]